MKIHTKTIDGREFQFWYDRTQGGNWWTAEFDAAGHQIGSAEFAADRDGIMIQIDYLVSQNIEDGLVARCSKCDKWINPDRSHIVHDPKAEPPGFLQLCDECAEPHLVACYCRGPKHPVLWTDDCDKCNDNKGATS